MFTLTHPHLHTEVHRRHSGGKLEKQLLVQLLDRYKEYQATNGAGFGVASATTMS